MIGEFTKGGKGHFQITILMCRVRAKIFATINYSYVLNKEGQEVRAQSLHFDQV